MGKWSPLGNLGGSKWQQGIVFYNYNEDLADLEDNGVGGGPVTSQPQAGQAQGAGMPVYAMPPPSSNPTNPFTGSAATESTGLNKGNQPIYTPGMK